MSRIICGRFDSTLDADAALSALRSEGFTEEMTDSFYVGPPGQHAMTPVGGDAPHSSDGTRHAGVAAAIGAVVGALLGTAVGMLIAGEFGAPAVFIAAGLGAYVGSFAGTMMRVRGGRRRDASIEHPVEPLGGRMIAVNVDRGNEKRAASILRRYHARDIGRTEGQWRNGSWQDFDPRQPLATV